MSNTQVSSFLCIFFLFYFNFIIFYFSSLVVDFFFFLILLDFCFVLFCFVFWKFLVLDNYAEYIWPHWNVEMLCPLDSRFCFDPHNWTHFHIGLYYNLKKTTLLLEVDQEIFNIILTKSMHQISPIKFRNAKFPEATGHCPLSNPARGLCPLEPHGSAPVPRYLFEETCSMLLPLQAWGQWG